MIMITKYDLSSTEEEKTSKSDTEATEEIPQKFLTLQRTIQ